MKRRKLLKSECDKLERSEFPRDVERICKEWEWKKSPRLVWTRNCDFCDWPMISGQEVIVLDRRSGEDVLSCCDDCASEVEWEDSQIDQWEDDCPPGYDCIGHYYSSVDPHGVYTPEGRKLGSTCGCEDYPCCGH